jgi:hypothetical protein
MRNQAGGCGARGGVFGIIEEENHKRQDIKYQSSFLDTSIKVDANE